MNKTMMEKSWKFPRLFCQDQDQDFYLKTKTKTLFFVLEAPQDQDLGLEDDITAWGRTLLRWDVMGRKMCPLFFDALKPKKNF